ncbi:MAG TPA: calcium/proton exchanger [Ktedonobacterales bacterium]
MPRWLLLLILALPAAIAASTLRWSPILTFTLAALALIPLAGAIGEATAALAARLGPGIGGLLNATFGNAAELIIGLIALSHGLLDVVRASIAGSVIGNSLLVLGTSMLVGGWRYRLQRFDARAAGQYASLLALAVVGLAIPTVVSWLGGGFLAGADVPTRTAFLQLSNVIAVVLLASYAAYIAHAVFGLRAAPEQRLDQADEHTMFAERAEAEKTVIGATRAGQPAGRTGGLETWLEPEHAPFVALVWLVGATVLTAVASDVLVGAIEPVAQEVGLSPFFIGLIVLPIVANAAEHFSAVNMALHDSMNTTMAITAGSAIQVALFLAPVFVLAGNFVGHPLALAFIPLELAIFALVALLFPLISLDGESTWLEGLQLVLFYVIVAASAFVIPH